MDPNDQTLVVADQTASPAVTDEGAPSSGAAESLEDTLAEALAKDFAQEHGDEEPGAPELEAPAAEGDAPEPKAPAQTPEEADPDPDDTFRIPEAEYKALSDGVKKRIGHLSKQLHKTRREFEDVQKELPTLRDTHQRFTTISTFVRENNIDAANVDLAFDAMARLSRGDFEGFLEKVKPWVDMASQAAGKAISPDLQQQVDEGYITEAAARELTKARISAQTAQAQAKQAQQRVQQHEAAGQQQALAQGIRAAVTQREQQIIASDPDYAALKPQIEAAVKLVVSKGGVPRSAQDAVKLLDDAYALAKSARPTAQAQPRPTLPRPTTNSPPRGQPAPKTLQDALEQAMDAISR